MAKYVTRIEADEKSCPVLLSNGNLVDEGKMDNGRYTSWKQSAAEASLVVLAMVYMLAWLPAPYYMSSTHMV